MEAIFFVKLLVYFFLWTLYSYTIHVIAHLNFRFNFLKYIHVKHHSYKYTGLKWPPLSDYFFWFGGLRASLDVWITFTLPLLLLLFIEFDVALTLLVFHYFYEVFLSRDILDHNPNITGKITRFIPIGSFHMKHHKYYKCNYSLFITFWDYLFRTTDSCLDARNKKIREARHAHTSKAENV